MAARVKLNITRNGSKPSARGPASYFTGTVRIDSPFQAEGEGRSGGAIVMFEPGARTNWHSHPAVNALTELMKVVAARKQRGVDDAQGREPARLIPQGNALMAAGTANQTKLAGAPVSGPLFEFAPVANDYLRAHLFGDIFERDNLDWQSREIATVGMLSALQGVEPAPSPG